MDTLMSAIYTSAVVASIVIAIVALENTLGFRRNVFVLLLRHL